MSSTPHILVVGAGPSGCLLALLLAEQGAQVSICDRRGDIRNETGSIADQQRSINLALSTRGITALKRVGLADDVMKQAVPMYARCVHLRDAAPALHPYGQPGQHLLSVSRARLTAALLDACEKHCRISLLFELKCTAINLHLPSATILDNHNVQHVMRPSLIVGADGTFSSVRAAMAREDGFDYSQSYIPCLYKELSFTPSNDSEIDYPLNALHIWPRHDFMLIALPNRVKTGTPSFTATLFMPRHRFDALRTPEDVKDFFQTEFPDAMPALPHVVDDFFNNPTPSLLTVRCQPYHFGATAVLIGDAAHAIVPFYGQGCNAAMEDATILSDIIQQHGWNYIGDALQEYSSTRKQDAETIADLAIDHYNDMSSRSASAYFVVKRRIEIFLNRLFPQTFVPLYSMVSFSNTPYGQAVQRAKQQDHAIGIGLGVGAALAAVCLTTVGIAMSRSYCRAASTHGN